MVTQEERGLLQQRKILFERIGPEVEVQFREIALRGSGDTILHELQRRRIQEERAAGVNAHELYRQIMDISASDAADPDIERTRRRFNRLIGGKMQHLASTIPDQDLRRRVIDEELMLGLARAVREEKPRPTSLILGDEQRIHTAVSGSRIKGDDKPAVEQAMREICASVPEWLRTPLVTHVTSPKFMEPLQHDKTPGQTAHNLVLVGERISPHDRPYFYWGLGTSILQSGLGSLQQHKVLSGIVNAAALMPEGDRFLMYFGTDRENGLGEDAIDLHGRNLPGLKRSLDITLSAAQGVGEGCKHTFYLRTVPSALSVYRNDFSRMEGALAVGVRIGESMPEAVRSIFYGYTLPAAFRTYGSGVDTMARALGEAKDAGANLDEFSANSFYRSAVPSIMQASGSDITGMRERMGASFNLGRTIGDVSEGKFYDETVPALYGAFGANASKINIQPLLRMGDALSPNERAMFYGHVAPNMIGILGMTQVLRDQPEKIGAWLSIFESMYADTPAGERYGCYSGELPRIASVARDIDPAVIPPSWHIPGVTWPGNHRLRIGLTAIADRAEKVGDAVRRYFIEYAAVGALAGSQGDEVVIGRMLDVAVETIGKSGVEDRLFLSSTVAPAFILYGNDVGGLRGMLDFITGRLRGQPPQELRAYYSSVIPAALGVYGRDVGLGRAMEVIQDEAQGVASTRRPDFLGGAAVAGMQAFRYDIPGLWDSLHDIRVACEGLVPEERVGVYAPDGWASVVLKNSGGRIDKVRHEIRNLTAGRIPGWFEKMRIQGRFGDDVNGIIDTIVEGLSAERGGVKINVQAVVRNTATQRVDPKTGEGVIYTLSFGEGDVSQPIRSVIVKPAHGQAPADPARQDDVYAAEKASELRVGPHVYLARTEVPYIVEDAIHARQQGIDVIGPSLSNENAEAVGRKLAEAFFKMIDNRVYPRASTPHPHPVIVNSGQVIESSAEPDVKFIDLMKVHEQSSKDIEGRLKGMADVCREHINAGIYAWRGFRRRFLEIATARGQKPHWIGMLAVAEGEISGRGWAATTPAEFATFFKRVDVLEGKKPAELVDH